MKLYDLGLSPNCLKVRAVIHELHLPVQMVQVDLFKGEAQTQEFLSKNPNGKVPVYEEGPFVLWESNAIIKHLAQKSPQQHLLPASPEGRALVDQWLSWQASHFYPPIVQLAVEKIFKPMGDKEPDLNALKIANQEFVKYAKVLDAQLKGKNFVLGQLTVVDFSLAASLYMRNQLNLNLSSYTHLNNWLSQVERRPSWIKALPKELEQAN